MNAVTRVASLSAAPCYKSWAMRSATFLEDRQHNPAAAGWLTKHIERHPNEPARIGLDFIGFGNTAARALGWYKPHKIGIYRSLGWPVPERLHGRIRRGVDSMLAAFRDDPTLTPDAVERLDAYDPEPLTRYTAVDAIFQAMTPTPTHTVLDFGSGIGRASLIWCWEREDVAFLSVDATESLYLLQAELYRRLYKDRVREFYDRGALTVPVAPGVVGHLPTWQLDRLPDQSVDLIIAVAVLNELPPPTLHLALEQFRRVIRPQGLLYIRDQEFWTPEHRLRVGRLLLSQGWHLAFRFPGNEGSDIWGVPRLWVYTGEDYSRYFQLLPRLKRVLLPSHTRSHSPSTRTLRSWRDIGLPI